ASARRHPDRATPRGGEGDRGARGRGAHARRRSLRAREGRRAAHAPRRDGEEKARGESKSERNSQEARRSEEGWRQVSAVVASGPPSPKGFPGGLGPKGAPKLGLVPKVVAASVAG